MQLNSFSAFDDKIQQLNTSLQLQGVLSINSPSTPARSCAVLPFSTSGYYWVRASNGSTVRVYCDMTRSCGGVTGGWMRVASLDMTNSSHQCPSGLRLDTFNIRTCRSVSTLRTCPSVTFPSVAAMGYSKVCGKIIAYQIGHMGTFGSRWGTRPDNPTLEENYLDGISLTHGRPRQHIWSFAAGQDESGTASSEFYNCPCTNTDHASGATQPPAFVENDYFCDTGSRELYVSGRFYADDPLWDGAGCGPLNTCCSLNTPPWFYKQLPQPTTDNIEMRVCRDELASDEDVAIEMIEIYVQ